MFLNINETRIKLRGIIAYRPFRKICTDNTEEYGIYIYYERKDIEIALPKSEISNVLNRLDEIMSETI